jgi:dihydroorotase
MGLWKGINDGVIDVVASDHAPCKKVDKEIGWSNIWKASAGGPGVETLLPLMIDQVNKGRLNLSDLVRLLCSNPARIFGFYPQKGSIQVGSDADLVMIDMKKKCVIRSEQLHTKSDFTWYDEWKIEGAPVLTISRGEVVMTNGYPGDVCGKKGRGKQIRPRMRQN